MMGYFASQFVAEVTHSLRQQLRGGIGQFFVLFFFVLFCFFLFNLFDFHFDHIESIEDTVPVGPVLIDVVRGEHFPGSFEVVLDEVDHGKDEPDSQQEGH
jgi:hypothetical protein